MQTVSIDNMTDNIIESEGLITEFEYPDEKEKKNIEDFLNSEINYNSTQKLKNSLNILFSLSQKNPKKLYLIMARIFGLSPIEIKKIYNSKINIISKPLNDEYISQIIRSIRTNHPELANIISSNNKRNFS